MMGPDVPFRTEGLIPSLVAGCIRQTESRLVVARGGIGGQGAGEMGEGGQKVQASSYKIN